MNTSAIIICAGDATRWDNYLGVPKHLITIEGERLLDRTVRLLKERGIKDIYVVVKEVTDAYSINGTFQVAANLNRRNGDADKFLSSEFLWNRTGRTLVLYGDCYFTEKAMDTIVYNDAKEWLLFCRPDASEITGTPWGECFAQSFYAKHIAEHRKALRYVSSLQREGLLDRCGGWEHYRAMTGRRGAELNVHQMAGRYVEINDFTDDFDYPSDYETWIAARGSMV